MRSPSCSLSLVLRRGALVALLSTAMLLTTGLVRAQSAREMKDITYATVDGAPLGLDLHLPAGVSKPPLLVWVHGGAWSAGTKAQYPQEFVGRGFAVASLDFRQTTHSHSRRPWHAGNGWRP